METLALYDQRPKAPVETCEALPINPECKRCELYQFSPNVCIPGEGQKGGLLVIGEHPGCFPAGTYVYTPAGARRIEEIRTGDIVYNGSGKRTVVKRLFSRPHASGLIQIQTLGGHTVYTTPEHPIWASLAETPKGTGHGRRTWEEPRWVYARDITRNHRVYFPKLQIESRGIVIDLSTYKQAPNGIQIENSLQVTPDLSFLLGAYMGDGCSSWDMGVIRICLSFGYKERHARTLAAIAESCFGVIPRVKHPKGRKVIDVRLYSRRLVSWFLDTFGKNAYEKRVPSFLFSASAEIRSKFLMGWYETDGSHRVDNTSRFAIATVSEQAARDCAALYLSLGLFPTFTVEVPKKLGHVPVYEVGIRNSDVKALGWDIKTHDKKARSIHSDTPHGFGAPIHSVKKFDWDGTVYNIETESNDYLVPFKVHNSDEIKAKRPFIGASGRYLRDELKKHWRGPLAIGNAVGCLNKDEIQEKHVDACRGYLAQLMKEAKPTRIICLGKWAAYSVLGFSLNPMGLRKAYHWLFWEGVHIPVLMIMHPAAALRNKHVERMFLEDLEWACKVGVTVSDVEPPLDPPAWNQGCVELIQNAQDSLRAIEAIKKANWFAFDVENAGRFFDDFRLDSLAICPAPTDTAYVWNRQVIDKPEIMAPVKEMLCSSSHKSVAHNITHEAKAVLNAWGTRLESLWFDTLLVYRLLECDAPLGLDHLSHLVGMGGHKDEAEAFLNVLSERMKNAAKPYAERAQAGKKHQSFFGFAYSEFRESDLIAIASGQQVLSYAYAYLPKTLGAQYVSRDAVACRRLATRLLAQLEQEPDLNRTWEERSRRAVSALVQMEEWGVKLSPAAIEAARSTLEAKLAVARQKVEAFGVNPRSPADIEKFLFDKEGLKPPHTLPSGHRSTNDDSLQALKGQHPVVDGVIEFRDIDHQLNTYVLPMTARIHPDGRAHFRYHLGGTPTGRSSAEGGIHQLPRPVHEDPTMALAGKMIRNMIVADPGKVLLEADFKQVQVYVIACECGDPTMLETLKKGEDIYRKAAQIVMKILGKDPNDAAQLKVYRTKLKIAILGTLFGLTPKSMAEDLKITEAEAKEIVDVLLFQAFPKLGTYIGQQKAFARKHGYVWGHYGPHKARKRWLTDILAQEFTRKNTAENNSVNHIAQNGEADIAIHALPLVVDWLKANSPQSKLVIWMHDAFICEVPEGEAGQVAKAVKNIMEAEPTPHNTGLRLRVDLKKGYAFGSLEDYEPPKEEVDSEKKTTHPTEPVASVPVLPQPVSSRGARSLPTPEVSPAPPRIVSENPKVDRDVHAPTVRLDESEVDEGHGIEKIVANAGERIELTYGCGCDVGYTVIKDLPLSAYQAVVGDVARKECRRCGEKRSRSNV